MSQSRSNKSAPKVKTVGQAAQREEMGEASFRMAKKLSDASKRHHTPGHARGSEQDRLQKRMAAAAAAREMMAAAKNRAKKKMKKPESGGKPKRITTKNPPGGSQTPGEKAKKKK
jgi:hypothetical protein